MKNKGAVLDLKALECEELRARQLKEDALRQVPNLVHATVPLLADALVFEYAPLAAGRAAVGAQGLFQFLLQRSGVSAPVAGTSLSSFQSRHLFGRDLPVNLVGLDGMFYSLTAPGWERIEELRELVSEYCRECQVAFRITRPCAPHLPQHSALRYVVEVDGAPRLTLDMCTDYVCRAAAIKFGVRARTAKETPKVKRWWWWEGGGGGGGVFWFLWAGLV